MKIIEQKLEEDNQSGNYLHYCSGCKQMHLINTKHQNGNGAIWSFNGDLNLPTFSPSIHIHSTDAKGNRHTSCHYHIINGMIEYCPDSVHQFSGQSIPLPEIPEAYL